MINHIYKDFNSVEMNIFINSSPDKYKRLCEIIGAIALDDKPLNIGITLPYQCEKGCVVVNEIINGMTYVLDIKYF